MKTQIIRIETHDDIISIKDKMGWGQTPRILLVWPKKGKILNRRLDLVYLKRHSKVLGSQLALVSKDSNVRYYAKKLNIPVYRTIRKAELIHWRRPIRREKKKGLDSFLIQRQIKRPNLKHIKDNIQIKPKSWLMHPAMRLFFFSFGVAGVLAIALIFVPSAEISMSPETHWETVTIPVSASLQYESPDLSGEVPAQIFSVIIEGRGNLKSTGSITIPDKKSQGKVVFRNMTDKNISIPAGLLVSSKGDDPIRFTTLESLEIAPNSDSELIPVEAIMAGSEGNVMSNHIQVIEGPLGLDLTVTNPLRTSRGSDFTSPAPRQRDYQELSNKLLDDLYNTAVEEFKTRLSPNDILLWTDPTDFEILEESFDPVEIQPADFLNLTLRVEYRAIIARGETIKKLGQSILEANLPDGFSPNRSTLEINHIQSPIQYEEMVFSWKMEAKWQTIANIGETETIQMVLWHKPEFATQQLVDNLPIKEDVVISINPTWWPRLPILPFRINVASIQSNNSDSGG